jgi:hypothetical protein
MSNIRVYPAVRYRPRASGWLGPVALNASLAAKILLAPRDGSVPLVGLPASSPT